MWNMISQLSELQREMMNTNLAYVSSNVASWYSRFSTKYIKLIKIMKNSFIITTISSMQCWETDLRKLVVKRFQNL